MLASQSEFTFAPDWLNASQDIKTITNIEVMNRTLNYSTFTFDACYLF